MGLKLRFVDNLQLRRIPTIQRYIALPGNAQSDLEMNSLCAATGTVL
jgi:hypothetical protein